MPLALLHWPLCVSVSVLGRDSGIENDVGENLLLVDPTMREEQVCGGEVLVAANREGEVCQIKKLGGTPAGAVTLLQCVDVALDKVKGLCAEIQLALDADAKKRDKGGLIAELRADNDR